MGHYKSNLRDIFFNLFEVLGRDKILGTGPYADMDHETAVAVLTEVDHLARTKLADSFAEVDRNLPVFDPSTYAVTLPEGLKRTYSALMESGSWQLELPAELGGQPTPPSVQWSVNELNVGANPAVYLYSTGPKFAFVLWANGTERDKKIAKFMVDRGWAASMVREPRGCRCSSCPSGTSISRPVNSPAYGTASTPPTSSTRWASEVRRHAS